MALAEIKSEKISSLPLGVHEESAPLRKILMWGSPGAETILGQLLPKKLSCFEAQFDVLGARHEFGVAQTILKKEGIEIVQVKDLFADMVKKQNIEPTMDIESLSEEITKRAFDYYKKYRDQDISDIEEVLGWLPKVLKDDVEKYGEKTAVVMNKILSLDSPLPLSNVLYARDQSNLMENTWVWSSMRHEIRQPEVYLFKTVLSYSGILKPTEVTEVQISGDGRFEGGDGIVNGGNIYIGVGGRTNLEGILQAAPSMLSNGGSILVPIDHERDLGTKQEMDAMHLDTIWMPSDKNEIVACEDEVSRRRLLEIKNINGQIKVSDIGWFADHLAKRGVDLIPLTKEEQEKYAPNFLNLGDKRVVLSLAEGNKLTDRLGNKGKRVYNANLVNITKGYGGLHCMTASIVREK